VAAEVVAAAARDAEAAAVSAADTVVGVIKQGLAVRRVHPRPRGSAS